MSDTLLTVNDREAFLLHLLVEGFLGRTVYDTVYELKHSEEVVATFEGLEYALREAARRHEETFA